MSGISKYCQVSQGIVYYFQELAQLKKKNSDCSFHKLFLFSVTWVLSNSIVEYLLGIIQYHVDIA
jgi:hypothetical protein